MRTIALAASLLAAASAAGQYNDPWRQKADAALGVALKDRTAAANARSAADRTKADYEADHADLVSLRAAVTQWCEANNASVPTEVYDSYLALRQQAESLADQGDGQVRLGDAFTASGENFFTQANEQYGRNQFQDAYYTASYAARDFGTARGYYEAAYSRYYQAGERCRQSYGVLYDWYATVSD